MNLKVLRVMANLTQAEVAEKLGVNQATVSGWEQGQYKPSAASVARLAEAYGVSVHEILKGVDLATAARANAEGRSPGRASRFGRPGDCGDGTDSSAKRLEAAYATNET